MKNKRWLRFGMRGLLVLVSLCSLACGYYAWNAQHYAAIKDLLANDVIVKWARQPPSAMDKLLGVYRFDKVNRIEVTNEQTDISAIANLNSLTEFRSEYMDVDLEPLQPHIKNLRVFSMYECPEDAGPLLQQTENLEEFTANTWQNFDLSWLKNNTKLKTLYITNAEKGLEHLGKFTELEYLQAPHELDTLEPLRKMSKLDYLDFSGSEVTSLEPLADLKALTYLYFEDCPIPQTEIDQFLDSIPNSISASGSSILEQTDN